MKQLSEVGLRQRTELLYEELDDLRPLRFERLTGKHDEFDGSSSVSSERHRVEGEDHVSQ